MAEARPKRRFWGWGVEGEGLTREQQDGVARTLSSRFDLDGVEIIDPPTLAEIDLRPPRVRPPDSLREICSTDPAERAGHTYGKSFRDLTRAFARDFSYPPDLVALPRHEGHVAALLDWCSEAGIAAIPYGGGSSVTGGVECAVPDAYPGVVSIDMRHLGRVVEVDRTSRAARIEAGTYGPALEEQLRPHGLTLRHFPQSFEFSTLGGWIATRAGGHYATLYTHIDDFVESLRTVTPSGIMESRRLPGSGAGPSPDRMILGSEGILGIITEAWMRLQDRPRFRASCAARFLSFEHAAVATRALAQSGLNPANCRLLDPTEALLTGADDGTASVLLVAFESAHHPLNAWIDEAVRCLRDHDATVPEDSIRVHAGSDGEREGTAGRWRQSFLRAPYMRDALVAMGMVNETLETACTWDRFAELYTGVTDAITGAAREAGCPDSIAMCRFTHVYPDGPAPYFTVIAPGRPGAQLEQWAVIKSAASDAVLRHGGTITHHHSVGRDHRPWYDRQRPPLFADALAATKAVLDPAGILNPGVLVDVPPAR